MAQMWVSRVRARWHGGEAQGYFPKVFTSGENSCHFFGKVLPAIFNVETRPHWS